MAEQDRKYVRFPWAGKVFQFKVMPFGLASAPRIFTKMLKPVVSLLRKVGIRLIIYLDDMLLMAESPHQLIESRNTTLFLLQNLGFVINWEKSQLIPCQQIEFLGFQINTQTMMFLLPQEKVQKIKDMCTHILNSTNITVREVAKLTGKLVSTIQAILPANLQCRFLQMLQTKALLSGKSYESKITLTKQAKEEICWWLNQIDSSNGRTIISSTPDRVITSDASNEGWGQFAWVKEQAAYGVLMKKSFI